MLKNLRIWLLTFLVSIPTVLRAADFNVTAAGIDSFYTINGQAPNPTLTLTRGQTYTFLVNADQIHPFYIFPEQGVSNNDTFNGTITYVVPLDAPDTVSYFCSVHGFGGAINIIDPPPPPAPNVKIVSISLTSSNVTLKSLGTNGWTGIQFQSRFRKLVRRPQLHQHFCQWNQHRRLQSPGSDLWFKRFPPRQEYIKLEFFSALRYGIYFTVIGMIKIAA
jgi:hypothetical protein